MKDFDASTEERREMFGMLKMQLLNCEETEMHVTIDNYCVAMYYVIDNGEYIELYYSKN
jgi:hypothetical protein